METESYKIWHPTLDPVISVVLPIKKIWSQEMSFVTLSFFVVFAFKKEGKLGRQEWDRKEKNRKQGRNEEKESKRLKTDF